MKSIIIYRVLAVLLGFTGVHNFYFQYKNRAIIQLAISILSFGFFIPIAWVLALYDIATISHENMSVCKDGITPLQSVLLNKNELKAESVVRLADELIFAGVDVNQPNAEGETALHMVARNAGKLPGDACEHIMQALLKAGANSEMTNAQKMTALQIVLRNEGDFRSEVCEHLAQTLLQTEKDNSQGATSLSHKIKSFLSSKLKKTVNENPLSFEETMPDSSPIWLLLYNEGKISGSVVSRLIRHVLQAGAEPDSLNSKGEHPLQYLAKEPENICSYISRDIVQYLVEFGADTRIRDNAGNTPLHQAAAVGNFTVVEKLLECGASVTAENKQKQKPLDVTESLMVKSIFASYAKNQL